MKSSGRVRDLVASLGLALVAAQAEESPDRRYLIPSWGDYAAVYANGIDPAMDSPEAMERMFRLWKARGFTGVFLRSDLQQYAPFVTHNARVQMNAPLALMWRHIDRLAERFDYFAAAQEASRRTGLEFWAYHPHIYSNGAPADAGVDGPGRMVPWNYNSNVLAEHPEFLTIDRRGNPYWMVPEYAYPEARRATVAEFVHMARTYGIKHFIANMRSEASQLQAPADKADRYGFNPPVVAEMRRLHGVDILTDPRFDVDAASFDLQDPMVQAWRDLRGGYLTQLFRELRAALREVDPEITLAITLAGEFIGPPLGNWRTDWRTWVEEGLVDFLISPVFFEATLDHDADKKGYLTHARAGIGTVSHEALRAYIKSSPHPEIQVISVGAPPYFAVPCPPGADGWQCDAWYNSYHLAWQQRWQQWQDDLRDLGHVRFLEQDFDEVNPKDIVMPSGGWGEMAYVPERRGCPGAWWRLGDGTDGRPFAQSRIKRGDRGRAIQLTREALTGWHNSSPDRGRFAASVDSSMTSGVASFTFWLWRGTEESGLCAYLQGDNREFEVGVRLAAKTGKLSYSTGTLNGAGQWVETDQILAAGHWHQVAMEVEIDQLRYRVLGKTIPLARPQKRVVELPGVNLPISLPSAKEFKSVLFVPEGAPVILDDVSVRWVPTNPYLEPGRSVVFADDFEGGADGATTREISHGPGVRSLFLRQKGAWTASLPETAAPWVVDLDLFVRSGDFPSILPAAARNFPHRTQIAGKDGAGSIAGAIATNDHGTWSLWENGQWVDTGQPVHYDVWNHLQLAFDDGGGYQAAVQPLGQVPALVGKARATAGQRASILTIEASDSTGHVSCYDNVRVTAGRK